MLRKPHYQFLSKKQREAVDWATEKLLLEVLESGDIDTFNTIIGVIQDLKNVAGRVSAEQEKCLRLSLVLFGAAVTRDCHWQGRNTDSWPSSKTKK